MRNVLYVLGIVALLTIAACTDPAHPIPVNTAVAKPTPPATNAPAPDSHAEEDNAPRITLAEAKKAYDAGEAVIVDVRDEMAYKTERIKDSLNIPMAQLDAKADTIPKGKKVIAYCSWRAEHSSASWVAQAKKKGIDGFALLGGTQAWKDAGYPMESSK